MEDKINKILSKPNIQSSAVGVGPTSGSMSPIYKSAIMKAYQKAIEERRGKEHVYPWTYGSVKDRVNNIKSQSAGESDNDLVSIIQNYRAGARSFPEVQTSWGKIVKPFISQIKQEKNK